MRNAEGGGGRWTARLRESLAAAPIGLLVIAALLCFFGLGLVLGATALALSRPEPGWAPVLGALLVAPLFFYLAFQLVALRAWAWRATVLLIVLMLATTVIRTALALAAGEPPVAPIAEMAAELLLLWYLSRPALRAEFVSPDG